MAKVSKGRENQGGLMEVGKEPSGVGYLKLRFSLFIPLSCRLPKWNMTCHFLGCIWPPCGKGEGQGLTGPCANGK